MYPELFPSPRKKRGLLDWSLKLTIHVYVLPRIKMSGAIPLLPLSAFRAMTGTTLYYCKIGLFLPCAHTCHDLLTFTNLPHNHYQFHVNC
jgi:hypothetical protein